MLQHTAVVLSGRSFQTGLDPVRSLLDLGRELVPERFRQAGEGDRCLQPTQPIPETSDRPFRLVRSLQGSLGLEFSHQIFEPLFIHQQGGEHVPGNTI